MTCAARKRVPAGLSGARVSPTPERAAELPEVRRHDGSLPNRELQSRVLRRLRESIGAIVSVTDLLLAAYGDDEDGGPEWPGEVIRHAVHQLRRRGYLISNHYGRGYMLRVWRS